MRGYGLDNVEKIDEFLNPKILDSVDLFVFPDIGYGDMQRHLRRIGKAVWGHMGATTLELYRDQFLEILEGVGLPTIPSKTIVGLSALREHLKTVEDKWIKVNCFRANSETWHHLDYEHSEDYLDDLAVIFGGAKEIVLFVVQDNLKSDMEIGYDGWCIDGQFPQSSFQGYEKKNELYLGSELSYEDLPDEIKTVNEAMAPVLKSFGYRGWWATEIRIKDGVPYFIDPTPRMPGQTGEHQLETCTNFAEVIWYGANGIVIPPEFRWRFAVEATLHFDGGAKHDQIVKEWRTLRIPKNVERWVKLYRYGKIDGVYKFAPDMSGEPGVVIGAGNTVEAAIAHLKKNLKMLKGLARPCERRRVREPARIGERSGEAWDCVRWPDSRARGHRDRDGRFAMRTRFFVFADGWRLYMRPLSDRSMVTSIWLSRPDGREAGRVFADAGKLVPELIAQHGAMRAAKASEI